SGMRMSSSARSGSSWRARLSASRPVAASPTTSMPGSPASMLRRPARASSWSSAMMTRAGPARRAPGTLATMYARSLRLPRRRAAAAVPLIDRQGHLGDDVAAASRPGMDAEAAAQQRDALSHALQSYTLPRGAGLRSIGAPEAATPVAYVQAYA